MSSWKPGFDALLRRADYVIASADFAAPQGQGPIQTLDYLLHLGVHHAAVTDGPQPIQFATPYTQGAVEVPQVTVIDTMGAGDMMHGAFCYFALEENFETALRRAAQVATFSCRSFGTRHWIQMWGKGRADPPR